MHYIAYPLLTWCVVYMIRGDTIQHLLCNCMLLMKKNRVDVCKTWQQQHLYDLLRNYTQWPSDADINMVHDIGTDSM